MTGRRVSVTAPARLHLGLLDLEGGLGRRFGSLGITLDKPYTRIHLSHASETDVVGPDAERARRYLALLADEFRLDAGFRLIVDDAIPAHAGLGSGTQMALAVGAAVARLCDLEDGPRDIAERLDRGARSGIGLGAFETGGVLLDGGRGKADRPPPIISRTPFPEDWRILLIFDRGREGLHGGDEVEAFAKIPPFPAESAGHLCRLAVMSVLPALAERDVDRFGAAVAEIQRVVGDHFAPAQGGRFASPDVADVLAWLESEGIAGVGQSSWGPTGFALLASQDDADRLLAAARSRWPQTTQLDFAVCRGANRGAAIEAVDAVLAAGE